MIRSVCNKLLSIHEGGEPFRNLFFFCTRLKIHVAILDAAAIGPNNFTNTWSLHIMVNNRISHLWIPMF